MISRKDVHHPGRTDKKRLNHGQRLYGRERAQSSLIGLFGRAARGEGHFVLVPGSSGVGKTSLVQSLRSPVRERNGFFLQGKFNQFQQNVPYYALREALIEFAAELKCESQAIQQKWSSRLQSNLSGLGGLLTGLVPEFELLIGKQQPVPEISPLEAKHRFAGIVRNVLQAICRPEHPLVLFIDDWQWADPGSLELLRQLRVGASLRYLLLVAAYRDNETGPAHPFTATVEELRRQRRPDGDGGGL